MAAELITPIDEFGIPLPIRPTEVLPNDDPEVANWHHAWHRASAPELNTVGGLALRNSRLQLVKTTDHNFGNRQKGKLTYHDFYIGPKLTDDIHEQFNMCVLSCGGYITREAIDLSGDAPVRVEMTAEEIERFKMVGEPRPADTSDLDKMRRKAEKAYAKQIYPAITLQEFSDDFVESYIKQRYVWAGYAFRHMVYRYEPIKEFFKEYALEQDLSHIKESTIEEFLTTSNPATKRFLGHLLLAKTLDVATDGVRKSFTEVRQEGRMHPSTPPDPARLVRDKLGKTTDRDIVASQLEERLKARYDMAA